MRGKTLKRDTPPEFKQGAVELYCASKDTFKNMAAELGIEESTLRK